MKLFDRDGLRAATAARAIIDGGPVRIGSIDGSWWVYADGVWAPGDKVVHGRIVRLLNERYRPAHGNAIRDVMRALCEEIDVAPVPQLINCTNGMVDWRAPGLPFLIPHDAKYLSTVQVPWAWAEGESNCAEFEAFLEQALAPDDRARVWELLGYLLMSGNPLQRMFLLTGGGGNGKGVLLSVIKALLGRRNLSTVPLTDFTDDKFAAADTFGKLCNICGDIDVGYIEKTGKIKALSGEDDVRGDRKFERALNFEFWGKAIFSANGIFHSSDSSHGWIRRWEVIHFPNEPVRPDRGLKRRLTTRSSLEAILVRAVLALRELMDRGEFTRGVSAREAHEEFALRSNPVLAWIAEDAYFDPSSFYPRPTLVERFRRWHMRENPSSKAWGSQTFYERLRQVKGMREVKIQGVRGFRGIRFNEHAHIVDLSTDDDGSKVPPYEGAGHDGATQEGLWPAETSENE